MRWRKWGVMVKVRSERDGGSWWCARERWSGVLEKVGVGVLEKEGTLGAGDSGRGL